MAIACFSDVIFVYIVNTHIKEQIWKARIRKADLHYQKKM